MSIRNQSEDFLCSRHEEPWKPVLITCALACCVPSQQSYFAMSALLEVMVFPLWWSAKAGLTYWLKERSFVLWNDHLCSCKQHLSSSPISRTMPRELNLHINLQNFQLTFRPVPMISKHRVACSWSHTFLQTLSQIITYSRTGAEWTDEQWPNRSGGSERDSKDFLKAQEVWQEEKDISHFL